MTPSKENYAFIDNENVNVSVQKQKRKLDRGKFRERLEKERKVKVAYMFMGYLEEYEPMYEFFTSLGYTLVFRAMNPNPDVPNKWNIDTDLVLQAMIDWPNYDQAVIVSGDGDFASLAKHLDGQGKLATVIVPNEHRYSWFLNEATGGKIVSLNLLKTELRYKPSGKKKDDTTKWPKFSPSKQLIKHTPKSQNKTQNKSQEKPQDKQQNRQQNRQQNKSQAKLAPTKTPPTRQNKAPMQQNNKPQQYKQPAKVQQQPATSKPTIQQPSKTQQQPARPQQFSKSPIRNWNSKKQNTYKSPDDRFYA